MFSIEFLVAGYQSSSGGNIDRGNMREIFQTVLKICLLRAGPQDLPDSKALLRFFCVAYIATGFLSSMVTFGPSVALILALLDVSFLALFVYALLKFQGLLSRYNQTFLALLGVGALMMFLSVPFLLLQSGSMLAGEPATGLPAILITLLTFWNLAAMGHVFKNAVNTSVFMGALISVSYLLLSLIVFGMIASNVQ